jgi:serine protease
MGNRLLLRCFADVRVLIAVPTWRRAGSFVRIANSTIALVALGLAAAAVGASPAIGRGQPGPRAYVPGEVLIGFEDGSETLLELPRSVGVQAAARALRGNREVSYAAPNYIAVAAGVPNDPGPGGEPGDWRRKQWNFLPCGSSCGQSVEPLEYQSPGGIDAIGAWTTIHGRGRGSGAGARVAVLDTGVAYRHLKPRFRKSPDFARRQFLRGRDFAHDDRLPLDQNGHGTHVTGTIAERTNNGIALTGLASAARIIPVRVLDSEGLGTARDIARGLWYAIKREANVINMSFEFSRAVGSCRKIPTVCRALRAATKRHGILVVGAAGNGGGDNVGDPVISYPAAAPRVLAVGGTTRDACVAEYSDYGPGLDLLAPGGGNDRGVQCGDPTKDLRTDIFQLTFKGLSFRRFGYPGGYHGTSMAAAHASGVAAMVISSQVLGGNPRRVALECQLEATARDSDTELGQPYDSTLMGAGLIDAAAAVAARAPAC